MPRCFARERARHRVDAPAKQAAYYSLLRQWPAHDRALIGQRAILAWLHSMGIRRRRGDPLTWRIVHHWQTVHACPILRGYHDGHVTSGPFTSSFALLAWLLSRFTSADLFKVAVSTHDSPLPRSFPASLNRSTERATL